MKKFLCLIVCLSLLLCTACADSSQTKSDYNMCPYVDFSVEAFDTTVNVRDKKTFNASLTNISGEELELLYGGTLITFYVHTEKQPKTFAITGIGITKNMAIDEILEREISFYFSKAGTYYLHAKYSFSIDGERYYYAIEPIEITVVE